MKMRAGVVGLCAAVVAILSAGCSHLPGKPGFRPETMRPDQTRSFAVLYRANCSACHGENGLGGAALPLNNPVYLAWAGHDRILSIVANGVPGEQMAAFGPSGGGLLTGPQVEDIVNGMIAHWGRADALAGAKPPACSAAASGDPAKGQAAFQVNCARCHGPQGAGGAGSPVSGSIVDPTYLSLISRQALRDVIVSGMPGEGMPDWRGDSPGKPMTDSDVTDIVAWLLSHRVANPGQPFPPNQNQETVPGMREKHDRTRS